MHVPVMSREVVDCLGCRSGGVYVDATLGAGGHAVEILEASGPDGKVVGIDRDPVAIEAAQKALGPYGARVRVVRGNFRDIRRVLLGLGIEAVDGIVADLGVSSMQLESPERGFSFRFDSRLDMRMDPSEETSAWDLVNTLGPEELARIFRDYGEEREAKRIARAVVEARKTKPVDTTGELARIILDAMPAKARAYKIHPATRVFQALRIAVNDELGSLKGFLDGGFESLKAGGRLAVISFHSLEDRLVKESFRDLSTGCVCPPRFPVCVCGRTARARLVTRGAVTPTDEEVEANPRARSARLRAVEKI